MYDLNCLLKIMKRLRDPQEGCEWDLSQTYETVLPHTIEEVYEVADAIERKDYHILKGELGDLLFQIVFYSQLSPEKSIFDCADVVAGICQKMKRRHPAGKDQDEDCRNIYASLAKTAQTFPTNTFYNFAEQ